MMSDDQIKVQLDELHVLCLKAKEAHLAADDNVVETMDWTLIMALMAVLMPLIFKGRPEMGAVLTQLIQLLSGIFK